MKGFMSIMSQFLVHKGAKICDFHRTSHQTHPTSSDGYTNELLSGGTTNYFESGTTNSCIFSKSGTTNSWLFNRRIMNSIRIELKNIIKTYLS